MEKLEIDVHYTVLYESRRPGGGRCDKHRVALLSEVEYFESGSGARWSHNKHAVVLPVKPQLRKVNASLGGRTRASRLPSMKRQDARTSDRVRPARRAAVVKH